MGARFGLGSRTGAAWETHSIDDLALQLYLDPTSNVPHITSITRQLPMGVLISGTGVPNQNTPSRLHRPRDLDVARERRRQCRRPLGTLRPIIGMPPYRFYRLQAAPQFPPGLVTWYRAEGNYRDSFGPNYGTPRAEWDSPRGSVDKPSASTERRSHVHGRRADSSPVDRRVLGQPPGHPGRFRRLLSDNFTALKLEQWPSTRQVGFTQFGVADYYFSYIVPTDTWLHLTFVGTPSGTVLYIDGIPVETNPAVVNLPLQTMGRRDTALIASKADWMK